LCLAQLERRELEERDAAYPCTTGARDLRVSCVRVAQEPACLGGAPGCAVHDAKEERAQRKLIRCV
jgi:hypothetical protein